MIYPSLMADAEQLAAGDMFKNLIDPWLQYVAKFERGWEPDDPRFQLKIEVTERFSQLDILLEYINRALRIFSGNPVEVRCKDELITQALRQVSTGEITKEKFMEIQLALYAKFPDDHRQKMRASDEIRLFTEAFYFFAWRLVEILTSKSFPFSGFSKLNVKGIQFVRNHLIEHPEKHSKNFRQTLGITSNGPVLKEMVVMQLGTGKSEPEETSLHRGLFVGAQELHDAINDILSRA